MALKFEYIQMSVCNSCYILIKRCGFMKFALLQIVTKVTPMQACAVNLDTADAQYHSVHTPN